MADIYVAPGGTYETSIDWGVTGLVGTLGVRLLDGQGATTIARTTAGITEFPATSGVYWVTRTSTAPPVAGDFFEFWDDGSVAVGHGAEGDRIVVTRDAVTPFSPSGNEYVTRDELKVTLELSGTTFADADIDLAVEAASRGIDNACGRRFYTNGSETRYYEAGRYDTDIDVGDLVTLTSLEVDTNGDGTYDTPWVADTDYHLAPYNAVLDSRPYERIVLRRQAGRAFPYYARTVKVVGVFGWSAVPSGIKQYAVILATQLLVRARQAPFGFVMNGETAARIARMDPQFDLLVGPYVRGHSSGSGDSLYSLQLG